MLERFLSAWLGAWPPPSVGRTFVGSTLRAAPAWDGRIHPVMGVGDEADRWIVSVPPERAGAADPLAGFDVGEGVFRWTEEPADLEPLGEWLPWDHPALPRWLRPFGGEVLAVLDDDGRYVAGVGLKRHLPTGWEISVGTEPEARGRGYARRLTATAARHCLEHGAVPLYLHDDDNLASARAATAAGFPDRGWRFLSVKEDALGQP